MNKNDYIGNYKIGLRPNLARMKKHNSISWAKIEKLLAASGGISSFDALVAVVKDHESGSEGAPHPYQFVTYCIKSGWLKPKR